MLSGAAHSRVRVRMTFWRRLIAAVGAVAVPSPSDQCGIEIQESIMDVDAACPPDGQAPVPGSGRKSAPRSTGRSDFVPGSAAGCNSTQ